MSMSFGMKVFAATAMAVALNATVVRAADSGHAEIERQKWSFAGPRGHFDKPQLQRGFQVYQQVCAACHGLKRINFRNLAEPGGPGFPEASVKALAEQWPNQIFDGPNDDGQIATPKGQLIKRPARLSDPILGPYDNDKAARAAQNGALPPDLSLITKARAVEYTGTMLAQPLHMVRDIVNGYQEGGSDYLFALLTGYGTPPADIKLADGMNFNTAFPGHQIAMVPPLRDGLVKYEDGSPTTVQQYARDVTAFLSWAGDPKLEERKTLGLRVLLYLLITTVLLYFTKKRLWAKLH
jgi:ubiquinol-cytochrome c reductase cytochrome c1 subunit